MPNPDDVLFQQIFDLFVRCIVARMFGFEAGRVRQRFVFAKGRFVKYRLGQDFGFRFRHFILPFSGLLS